jgi:murein L,D-transpeptidase YcbB/YkuD
LRYGFRIFAVGFFMTGRGWGNLSGLAFACLAGAIALSCAASADEIAPVEKAPRPGAEITIDPTPTGSIDATPTGALRAPSPKASAHDGAARSAGADQPEMPFRPELPPDDAGQPVAALPSPASASAQPAPAAPAPERPHGAPSIAKSTVEAAPAAPLPSVATPADVEAAVEAMLKTADKSQPASGPRSQRTARIAVGVFYFKRGFAPYWTNEKGFTHAAQAAIARLSRAGEDGLDLSAFAIPAAGGKEATPAQRAEAEIMLSQAIVAYAVEASGGRIDPTSISAQITAKPEVADPASALALVAAADDPGAALEDFNPPHAGYRELRDRLAQLRADRTPVARIPAGPLLKIGMSDPRVPLVRARVGLGALASGEADDVYDLQVANAVAGFQRANGLAPTGLLTAGTLQALSGDSASRQEAAILANMEMWRWEPRDLGQERVEVNIPDFSLKVTQGDEVLHRARVIVGKPDTPTAIFSNSIKYLLVNPAWVVPPSIIKKEMMPKLLQDPDYLVRAGFEVTQKGDQLIVRQPPGERNALGHILFMFPNEHSIYLHDTPGRGLFASARRAFSHGCVRVDDPMRLGELVMGGAQTGWTQARLRSLVGDKERTIFLPHPLAIHIEYFTAFVDDAGALQMREDIYGFERRVEAALDLESRS